MRHLAGIATASAGIVLALAACGASAGTSPPRPLAPVTTAAPAATTAAPAAAPPSTSPALVTSCSLGYVGDNSAFYPDTAAGLAAVGGDGSVSGFRATFANHGTQGQTLAGYTVTASYQGTPTTSQAVTLTTPYFIAPGETYASVVPFSSLSGGVDVSTNTYQHSACSVTEG